ncbi:anthranilate synthase component II [Hyalangium versicolor]|uniref:anthranilate synthase component II n=1 Tax=Hyalangium versicolor TaxID=2861190 RepID=UPI001CCDA82A|nr:aminodeoxychorismate/anthranilate synthase component II [Hyalangium versicolor]
MSGESRPRIVLIDNYDSFVYNLYQSLGELTGVEAKVVRNDRTSVDAIARENPTHLIISPGPGNPEEPAWFGICRDVILTLGRRIPLLGVCLGHQGIGVAFGGRVIRAPRVMHGKTSRIRHDGEGLFAGLESPLEVMRYHSLVIDPATLPASLGVTASTDEGLIMGVVHREFPIVGLQFHPESIGTRNGQRLLRNFLEGKRR